MLLGNIPKPRMTLVSVPLSAKEIAERRKADAQFLQDQKTAFAALDWTGIDPAIKARLIKNMGADVDQHELDWIRKYNITDNPADHVFDVELEPAFPPNYPAEMRVTVTPKKHWEKEDCVDDQNMSSYSNVIKLLADAGLITSEGELMESMWESSIHDPALLISKIEALGLVHVQITDSGECGYNANP